MVPTASYRWYECKQNGARDGVALLLGLLAMQQDRLDFKNKVEEEEAAVTIVRQLMMSKDMQQRQFYQDWMGFSH